MRGGTQPALAGHRAVVRRQDRSGDGSAEGEDERDDDAADGNGADEGQRGRHQLSGDDEGRDHNDGADQRLAKTAVEGTQPDTHGHGELNVARVGLAGAERDDGGSHDDIGDQVEGVRAVAVHPDGGEHHRGDERQRPPQASGGTGHRAGDAGSDAERQRCQEHVPPHARQQAAGRQQQAA